MDDNDANEQHWCQYQMGCMHRYCQDYESYDAAKLKRVRSALPNPRLNIPKIRIAAKISGVTNEVYHETLVNNVSNMMMARK
jgi:hypothetical protein